MMILDNPLNQRHADGGIVGELQSRHGHSAQPESQQTLAVLQAVLEVIASQGMPATPTTIFAALMSALERPDAQQSHVTALAMCTVLSVTLTRVPNGVLRSKFVGSVRLLSAVVEHSRGQAPACKAALQCLGQVLCAVEPSAWLAAAPGFQLLLSFSTEARPKIRKRAAGSVQDVLGALQGSPASLGAASEAVLALCKRVLPGPAAAQRAAAAATNKQRSAAEAAIVAAVSDLLHVLGALKAWAPLMSGASLPGLIDGLLKLYALHQPLVSRHTSEVLAALAGSSSSHLSPGQLAQLLGLLIDGQAGHVLSGPSIGSHAAAAGGDGVTAMARLLEGGLLRLVAAGSSGCDVQQAAAAVADAARLLPRVVHLLVPLLSAEQDGVRYSASGALQSLITSCLTPPVLVAMQQQKPQQQKGLSALDSLVAAAAASLGARYQEAWALGLPVAAALFQALAAGGPAACAAAAPLLAAVGQICAGLSDAAEQREAAAMAAMDLDGPEAAAAAAAAAGSNASYAASAEAALGSAIRHLGPEAVLTVLPLDLHQGLDGSGEARTWLLPALRRHVAGASLCYWARHLLPLTREMGQAAAAASQRGNKGLAAACHALELQLWAALQSFANWPTDAAAAYKDLAPALASAFHTREDLRPTISGVLVKLCRQARGLALAALALPPGGEGDAAALPLSALRLHHSSSSSGGQGGLAAPAAAAPGGLSRGASAETRTAIAALALVDADAAAVRADGDEAGAAGGGAQGGDASDADDDAAAGLDGSDDEVEEYGAGSGGNSNGSHRGRRGGGGSSWQHNKQQQQHGGGGAAGDGGDANAPSHAPPAFSADVALAQLLALRQFSGQWMKLLCKIFIDLEPEARGPVGDALAGYASISEPRLLAELYTITMKKYQKVAQDASVPSPLNPLLEGGPTPEERQASFLELGLCLAAGMPDAALDPLFVVCQQHVLGGSSLLQKRAYRVLAYLCGSRPAWLAAHLVAVLELLLIGGPVALSPAKRYRLRCLRPIILLLDTTPCPPLPGLVDAASGAEKVPGGAALAAAAGSGQRGGAADGAAAAAEQRRLLLAQNLVGEVVLATKEVNKKTRTAGYELLVSIAHELDEARPLTVITSRRGPVSDDGGEAMDSGDDDQQQQLEGGLLDFVNAVMAGLVGSSPHMQSAAVLALARLVFEFAGQLEGVVSRLLPAVLLLLRSHSREVIKAVLGFIKVCAMRMPADLLMVWLPQLLEGMLLWADDSKNKFRLKVRVIIERLVRRCGVEPVAAACPPGDAKLMAHIRKQQGRKERRRAASEAGSQADEAEFDRRSRRSSGAARTARASEWGHTAIFSNEDDGDGQTLGGRSGAARSAPAVGAAGGARSVAGGRGGCRQQQQQQQQRRRGLGGGMQLAGDGSADPQDLLEPSTVRQLVKAAAGAGGGGAAGSAAAAAAASFPRGDDGRYVIREEDGLDGRKRKRGRGGADDGFGSDHDSDMEDMRGFAGLDAAIRSVANAKSVRFAPTIAASLGNRSAGQRSNGTARSGGSGKQQQQQQGGRGNKQHSGDRFRPKAAGTAGDVKGRSSVDPYAYWSFDKKMLNRRRGKQAAASKGLSGVVAGAQAGALKGAKAKRAAQAAKRQRR